MKKYFYYALISLLTACDSDFLELKSDKSLVVPSSIEDYQALLDYTDLMNTSLSWSEELQADDYYITAASWQALGSNPFNQNAYIWAKDLYAGANTSIEYNVPYSIIYQANVVLDGLKDVNRNSNPLLYDQVKARALFFRAWQTFRQALVFASAYADGGDNNSKLGVPLRTNADIDVVIVRPSLEATFAQILTDLNEAEVLFSDTEPNFKTRPSKVSCFALIARVLLYMQRYDQALEYAQRARSLTNAVLIDYAAINANANFPFARFNSEVLFHASSSSPATMAASRLNVDSTLYNAFSTDDYRRTAWFRLNAGRMVYKGSYDGSSVFFAGIGLSELYLIQAECLIRVGSQQQGLNVLAELLQNRVRNFQVPEFANSDDALAYVLLERRKELIYKGLRWMDLKRLNLETSTAKTLFRNLDGRFYTLQPNGRNYVMPIPNDVLEFSDMQQNDRD